LAWAWSIRGSVCSQKPLLGLPCFGIDGFFVEMPWFKIGQATLHGFQ